MYYINQYPYISYFFATKLHLFDLLDTFVNLRNRYRRMQSLLYPTCLTFLTFDIQLTGITDVRISKGLKNMFVLVL